MSNSEERNHCVYMITSPSGKCYIGLTNNFKRRMQEHIIGYSKSSLISKAIHKYSKENMKFEILFDKLTLAEANLIEDAEVTNRNTLSPNGYNLHGGGASHRTSDETRLKQSISAKLKAPVSQESIEKRRLKMIGRKLNLTDEQRLAKSIRCKGIPLKDEQIAKMSASNYKLKFDSEYPLYLANIRNLPDTTEFTPSQLGKLVGSCQKTIRNRVNTGLFANSYKLDFFAGKKPTIIPIQDVHDYYNR